VTRSRWRTEGPQNLGDPCDLKKIKDELLDLVLVILLLGSSTGHVVPEIPCHLASNLASFGVEEGLCPV